MPLLAPPTAAVVTDFQIWYDQTSNATRDQARAVVAGYNQFWSDPIGSAPRLNAACVERGSTAEKLFQTHQEIIGMLYTIDNTGAWIADINPSPLPDGTPIPVTYDPAGMIDIPALTTAWEAYQLAQNPPPEEPAP